MTFSQTSSQSGAGEPRFVDPGRVAGCYQVLGVLGRGGMASVYRVRDTRTGDVSALKRLCGPEGEAPSTLSQQLFEREFHTLNQLQHPRIVRAYDYGLDGDIPFYTMEILDGGDLRELAPMPEADVCQMAYEVCSALSLLHSRRLVHRDLTPRNVRKTAGGKAKLIDFGLMSPMEPNQPLAGTPPYVAPELLHGLTLDARSDLFSLGATMYFALTGFHAFPARKLSMLKEVWRTPPKAPSTRGAEVSERLDALVLSLVRIDVGSRPKSAAEVMDRLRPMLSDPPDEALTVADAYLSAPQLVGRSAVQVRVRKQLLRSARGRGGGFLVKGVPGTGRSRFVDACALEGKLIGATVLRADAADAASGPFGMTQSLAEQLHRADPSASLDAAHRAGVTQALFHKAGAGAAFELQGFQESPTPLPELQAALRDWILSIAAGRPIALVVDDLHQADAPSLSLFAALSLDTSAYRLTLVGATDASVLQDPAEAFAVLEERLTGVELAPLERSQTFELLRGVFGDIPNLTRLADSIHDLATGLPRETMMLAQHLTDHGVIRYAEGAWILPAVFDDAWLPATTGETLSAQAKALSPQARQAGLFLALSVHHRLSHTALQELMGASSAAMDGILTSIRSAGFAVGGPRGYMLRHGSAERLFAALATERDRALSHDGLANFYEQQDACAVVVAFHELQGSNPTAGLHRILDGVRTVELWMQLSAAAQPVVGNPVTAQVLDLAHQEAQRQGCGLKVLCALWSTLAAVSATGESMYYYDSVPASWLEHLKEWTGYNDLQALPADLAPAERAVAAFSAAAVRYEATPEAARVLSPVEALRALVGYVIYGIAVGSRTSNLELIVTLPPLLEPFRSFSPIVEAMFKNALATQAIRLGQTDDARVKFSELMQVLSTLDDTELKYIDRVRTAMVHAVNLCNSALGIQQLVEEETLRRDPSHQVGLNHLKRIMAMQRGDWKVAETCRHDAELMVLQNGGAGMFVTLSEEFWVCANARDLPGLKTALERAAPLAAEHPGWRAEALIAEANYHLLRGEPAQAIELLSEMKRAFVDEESMACLLFAATAVEVAALTAIGELDRAVTLGRQVLRQAREQRCFHFGRDIANPLALAESAAGQSSQAKELMHEVLVEQQTLGVSGLLLGRTYATLARIAINEQDAPEFERWAQLAAEQYRPGESEVLGQLYEQLIEESRRCFSSSDTDASGAGLNVQSELFTHVNSVLSNVANEADQAQAALELLCEHEPRRRTGFLFLLNEAGLSLLGSNDESVDRRELQAFAEAQLESQLDDDMCTLTSGDFTAAAVAAASASTFVAADGTPYLPLPLGADDEGTFKLVGIALISDDGDGDGDGRRHLDAVVTALARHLLSNPRLCPVAAA